MSAITIENDLVHYEVLGRGRPVILVHGWLGSWRYWVPAMQQLSMKYRTYAVDLWGFGDSGRDARRYDFASQVLLLDQFMEKMGITKAALVGHDLGAAVCARYAVQHPDRVPRLMVISPPLFWMAPRSTPLTANLSPGARALPPAVPVITPPASPIPPTPSAPGAAAPADAAPVEGAPPSPTPAAEATPADSTPSAADLAINAEADTMPWRTDEMKARIRAALDKRARETGEMALAPKSPRDAAVPPVSQPAREIGTPILPEQLPDIPAMPKLNYLPESPSQVQRANPLKEHLGTVDRVELLKRHVDAGPDLDKLRVEVEKADTVAIAVSVESFADVDTLRDLRTLSIPIVALYGSSDTFVPAPDARILGTLTEGRATFHPIAMDGARHFPMLENIAGFTRLLLDFLEVPDVTKLTIKETWERRVR